jgi:polypeptide N-acetylgalactosaminyltransferase
MVHGAFVVQLLYHGFLHVSLPCFCRTILAIPIIDGIDWDNFRYNPVYQGRDLFRGIFEWGFLYKESKVPEKALAERNHASEPYK